MSRGVEFLFPVLFLLFFTQLFHSLSMQTAECDAINAVKDRLSECVPICTIHCVINNKGTKDRVLGERRGSSVMKPLC